MRQRLDSEEKVRMFGDGKKEMDIWKRVRKWREVGVVWEQPLKAEERERPVVTTPGFSFSAAGLLFPYHLGVAKLLIEKGYIKETTPLAGSSAGAIVCAVVASGASMDWRRLYKSQKFWRKIVEVEGLLSVLGYVSQLVCRSWKPNGSGWSYRPHFCP
ncbi:putative patatin-like phospholipase domain-containing protein [Helianthus annuus]|nr:putative patatin-like phospholipase domain-containing protein [Helianthus annuus]